MKKRPKHSEVAAIEEAQRRLRLHKSKGLYKEAAAVHNELGNQFRLLGQFEDALEHHQEEVNICKLYNKNDKMGLGIAYRNMAEVYIDMKKAGEAEKWVRLYLDIARQVENFVEEQRALITLGRTFLLRADEVEEDKTHKNKGIRKQHLETAKDWFEKAYMLLQEGNVKEQLKDEKEFLTMKCNNCQNLGATSEILQSGQHQAIKWYEKAVEIGKKLSLVDYLYTCYYALANLYVKQRDLKKAVVCAQGAVKVAITMNNPTDEIEAKLLQAKMLLLSDSVEEGKRVLKHLRKKIKGKASLKSSYLEDVDTLLVAAVKLSRYLNRVALLPNGDEGERNNPSNSLQLPKLHEKIADNYAEVGAFPLAIESYLKAIEFSKASGATEKRLSSLYFSVAECYKDLGEYSKALEFYQKEMSFSDDDDENGSKADERFKTQTHITLLMEKWKEDIDPASISKEHKKTIALAEETNNPKRIVTAYTNYSAYLKYMGDSKGADNYLQKAQSLSNDTDSSEAVDSQDLLEDDSDDEDEVDLSNLSSDGESEGDEDDSERHKNVAQLKKRVVKRKNEAGETPLHIAAKRGDVNAIRRHIRDGLDVNARDTAGWTPLHEAVNFGHTAAARALLEHAANVNDQGGRMCEGISPLHDALSNGHLETATLLLEKGANVLLKDHSVKFPIDHLVIWRHGLDANEGKLVDNEYNVMKRILEKKMQDKGRPYSSDDERRSLREFQKKNRLSKAGTEFTVLEGKKMSDDFVPVRIANDAFDPDDVDTATKEYQNAMRNLSRQQQKKLSSSPKSKKAKEKKPPISPGPRNALIPSDLDVHEDWLVGDSQLDVVRPRKNRRISDRKRKSRSRSRSPSHSRSSSPVTIIHDEGEDEERFRATIEDSIHSPFYNREERLRSRLESNSSPSPLSFMDDERSRGSRYSPSPSPPLSPLLHSRQNLDILDHEMGDEVIEDISMSPNSAPITTTRPQNSRKNRTIHRRPSESSIPVHPPEGESRKKRKREDSRGGALRLKIHILDHTLMVPVDSENRSRSIEWLCDQVSVRYQQFYKVKPILRLSTKDGALLCSADCIDLVLGGEEELNASVISYDVPTLSTRFKKSCTELKLVPKPRLLEAITLCESSGVLDLSGINMHGKFAKAVFTSLKEDSNVKVLKLSECCLFDEDILELGRIFFTLSSLSVMDLSCNALTYSGLRIFNDTLRQNKENNSNKGVSLKEVNLDFNPLTNRVAKDLLDMVQYFAQLRFLSTTDCDLTRQFYSVISNEELPSELDYDDYSNSIDKLDVDRIRSFCHR